MGTQDCLDWPSQRQIPNTAATRIATGGRRMAICQTQETKYQQTDSIATIMPDGIELPERLQSQMDSESWGAERKRAWESLYDARPGDKLVWSDRSLGMTVEATTTRDGNRVVEVAKPRADGSYEVREDWSAQRPRIVSDIGRANNLRIVERGDGENARGLTEYEYDALVDRHTENAVDAFTRMDYEDWSSAVSDVVESWSSSVTSRNWRGYRYPDAWQDGDAEAIFQSVVDHGDFEPDGDSLKRDAEAVLVSDVTQRGQQRAESTIVQNQDDYRRLVDRLAHHVMDRIDRKNYADARVASRDTVSDWLDDRAEDVHSAIIDHGTDRFDDDEYGDYDAQKVRSQRAFDTLEYDVWEETQLLLRDEGRHDPALRGMTRETYQETVDHLVAQTLRRWDNDSFLRTTAKDVVSEWADSVEAEDWGGHRHNIWAAGDVEDIFASATIHSTVDPFIWNPFASDSQRRLAVQAMTADVVTRAEDTYDEEQPESDPVPVDEYMDDVLDVDTDYAELKEAQPEDVEEVAGRIIEAMDEDVIGWTFVDEIIEHEGVVVETTNDWVLIDYGVIRQGETLRKLAWFNRGTGDVVVLSGKATAAPMDLASVEEPYEKFHVTLHEYDAEEPLFICEDVSLERGLECVYDFVDADKADVRIIETPDGEYVQEQITNEDINATGVVDALVPNLPWGSDDIITAADDSARGAARFTIRDWAPEFARMASYTAIAVAPRWLGERLDGIQIEPTVSKKYGVGTRVSKQFGSDKNEAGVGGIAEVKLNVRPQTFANLGNRYADNFISQTFNESDVGKGAFKAVEQAFGDVAYPDADWEYETARKIANKDPGYDVDEYVDNGDFEGLKSLADDAMEEDDSLDPKKEKLTGQMDKRNGNPKGTALAKKLYGWANYQGREEVPETYGALFLDTYGSSVETFMQTIKEGSTEYEREQAGEDVDEGDITFNYEDFENQDIGLSAMLMRGLDAQTLVSGAKFFDIDERLDKEYTFHSANHMADPGDPPTYEEWVQDRYGPGKPAGPEEEARRMARFHKEVGGADFGDVDPYEAMGVDEQTVEERSDYDAARFDFDDTFGNAFDNVAERVSETVDDTAADVFARAMDLDGEGNTSS